jgi:hypothetical protein
MLSYRGCRPFVCCFALCLVLLCVSVLPAPGQMGSDGTLNVLVLDPSGASVGSAELQLVEPSTNDVRASTTQEGGTGVFAHVPLGTYRLIVHKDGFKDSIIETVVIQGGRVTDVKVVLQVGSAVERVTVDAAVLPIMETTSNSIVTTIDIKQIEDLPLSGRDVSALAQLSVGYSGAGGFGTWNGLPLTAQGNTIDGVVSSTSRMKFAGNVIPGLEARLEDIQEMTVQTSQVDLSQGMGMSAMQVNFVTRRGSNDYHGRAYEDFRNTVLDANSWTNNANGAPRTPLILNNFGGSVGGHIIKDKLFFFGSFSMAKQPGGYIAPNQYPYYANVLTPLAQSGIYTDSSGKQINLFQIAAANGLPSTVNPAIATELSTINTAVQTPGTQVSNSGDPNFQNLNWLVDAPITRYYPAFRVDYNATQSVRIDFSYEETKYNQPNANSPFLPGSAFSDQTGNSKSTNYIGSLGVAWTITPTMINQFRGGYYYNAFFYTQGAKPLWLTQSQQAWAALSGTTITSGADFTLPITTFYPVVNFSDNLTWMKGRHSAVFGMDFYREQDHYYNAPDGIPNISLGLVPGDPAYNAFNAALINEPLQDQKDAEALYSILVGRISGVNPVGSGFPLNQKTGQYASGPGSSFNLDELQKGWGIYAQDSFRFTPRFTVNYGLRWDFVGDDHDLTGRYHGADMSQFYGPSLPGDSFAPGTLSSNLNPSYVAASHQYNPFNVTPQPTIGLAWNPVATQGIWKQLLGTNNTVIRTGFDIKRYTEPYQFFWNNASNYGKAFFQYFDLLPVSGGGQGTFAPGSLSLGNPLPPTLNFPSQYANVLPQSLYTFNSNYGGAGMDPNIHQPYLMEWNLGIQRQIGASNVLEIRYMGHRTLHQWVSIDPNEVNIFENGFLKEFQAAQSNLKICMSTPACSANPNFGNSGLPGQVNLPVMSTAFGGSASTDFSNPGFITDLNQGAAGAFASSLAYPNGDFNYICNLVGTSLTPCGTVYGYTSPGPYPVNFLQANPYLDPTQGNQAASWLTSLGYSTYHALQIDFRQKSWHGMQFDVNYTWSHTLGIQPDNSWTGNTTIFTIRDLRDNYGPTTFDLRNVLHASGTFDLPFGKGRAFLNNNGVLDKVVGGWTLGTLLTINSGFPFQLMGGYYTYNDYADGGFVLNGTTVSQLQKAIGVYNAPGPYKSIFNPAALTTPSGLCSSYLKGVCQNTTPGTLGFNPWLIGPGTWNDDMSISKAIPITERVRFTLQAEALNVFNHPNWANPNTSPSYFGSDNVGASTFGQMTPLSMIPNSTNGGARMIELRANITF